MPTIARSLLAALTTTEIGALSTFRRCTTTLLPTKCSIGSASRFLRCLSSHSDPDDAASKSSHHCIHSKLRGTVGMLRPEWWHLSPCFGAALQCSPLKHNLIRLAQSMKETERIEKEYNKPSSSTSTTSKSSKNTMHRSSKSPLEGPCQLLERLFFQPQPGAPIRLTKSKSMAAAYLTPSIMGTLLGVALKSSSSSDNAMLEGNNLRSILLDRHGIKSNHVQGEWTGVSLARWKELIHPLQAIWNSTSPSSHHEQLEGLLVAALWSMAVWECCSSATSESKKQSIEDYLRSLQEVSGLNIMDPGNDNSILAEESYSTTVSSMEGDSLLQTTLERLRSMLSRDRGTDESTQQQTARAIEDVCVAVASQQQGEFVKPTTPNGYYGYDGGSVKPDCVEVAIRELMDYMLWNDQTGRFDVSRLPSSACPDLIAFYEAQCTVDSGEEWFEMMSDIPGCLYLTSSPNGRPYELTPTLRNVAKVVKRLLYNEGTLSRPVSPDDDWEYLSRLQEKWHHEDLQLSFDMFSEKAKMSSEIHIHEVVTVNRKGKTNAIELRLRCDWSRRTGFATVTHLRSSHVGVDETLLAGLLETFSPSLDASKTHVTPLIGLPLLADFGVLYKSSRTNNLFELVFVLLSCRYGIDRREMLHISATSDLEREEAALRKAQRESEKVLVSAMAGVCRFVGKESDPIDRTTGVHLLNWLLSESNRLNHSEFQRSRMSSHQMEEAILALPGDVKYKESLKFRVATNWAVRGQLLRCLLDWRSGEASLVMTLKKMRFRDWGGFFLWSRRLR